MFNLEEFINTYVTRRDESMFQPDIDSHSDELEEAIGGKSVLIIGAGGSIGSSFTRVILPYRPSELVLVDLSENYLAELSRSLRSSRELAEYIPSTYIPYAMDFNSDVFRRMFRAHKGFDIVANFSAHKHVRSEKDIYSIEAMFRNNVLNAKGLLDLLTEYPPNTFFCVSTDKAANPVSLMGAGKRILEDVAFSYSDVFKVSTARFANVAFSNGSLPDGFLHRLSQQEPLSAPSDVRRYFVSPRESGQICMLAAMVGSNREIFFPKLEQKQMTTFDKIAVDILYAHGYEILECDSDEEAIRLSVELRNRSKKYPVHFSASDTSGEKYFEEFYTEDERIDMNRFKSLGVITDKPVPDKGKVIELINELDKAFNSPSIIKDDIVKIIKSYLPNFEHIETGKCLDGKM